MSRILKKLALGATGVMTIFGATAMGYAQTVKTAWEMIPGVPNAQQTDPVASGLMQGFPPPADKRVQFRDRTAWRFPQLRWSLSHWREIAPTKEVSRGTGPVLELPRSELNLDNLKFKTTNGIDVTFKEAIDLMYSDGLLILHKGRIVYETYRGAGRADTPHLSWSVTKSYVGTIAAILAAEHKLDLDALVTKYVPELKDSAYGDATVRQVMDMRIGAKFSENYGDPNAEIRNYGFAAGLSPAPADYKGPLDITSYLTTIKKQAEHGQAFHYMTINAEALAWIVSRAAGKPLGTLLEELIWTKIGAEGAGYINVDSIGTEAGGTGFSSTLRDMARFGEVMRKRGKINGKQIIPAAAFDEILKTPTSEDKAAFNRSGYDKTLPGWTYHDMWWIADKNGAYSARGIYGQAIYIDPKAEMVVVRYASMPVPGNAANDPITQPFYAAVAAELTKSSKK